MIWILPPIYQYPFSLPPLFKLPRPLKKPLKQFLHSLHPHPAPIPSHPITPPIRELGVSHHRVGRVSADRKKNEKKEYKGGVRNSPGMGGVAGRRLGFGIWEWGIGEVGKGLSGVLSGMELEEGMEIFGIGCANSIQLAVVQEPSTAPSHAHIFRPVSESAIFVCRPVQKTSQKHEKWKKEQKKKERGL